jgi:predicted nucleic acid-binding protein
VRYWDASALLPLVLSELASTEMLRLNQQDREIATWWATEVECLSGIMRRQREGLNAARIARARARLTRLGARWSEVQPSPALRDVAGRLLELYPLRAADALQLAAGNAIRQEIGPIPFVTLDRRLAVAAVGEGFTVLPPSGP